MLTIRTELLRFIRRLDDALHAGRKRPRVLFVMSDGYGFSCQAPVIQAMLKMGEAVIHTTIDKPRALEKIGFVDEREKNLFHQLYVPPRVSEFRKWNIVVDTHRNGLYPRRHTLRAYMHHGPGFGILGSKVHVARDYDVFLGLSETERYFLERIDPNLFKTKRFVPIGFPKADGIVWNMDSGLSILHHLGLPRRKTILITSHWQPSSILGSLQHRPFKLLAEAFPDHNVIQTGHPWLWEKKDSGRTIFSAARQIANSNSNAFFLPFVKAEDLLVSADLLVADHSSIITSFSLLDRPIVWYDNPEARFAIPEVRSLFAKSSHAFTSLRSLRDACRSSFSDPQIKSGQRYIMNRTFFTDPGFSARLCARRLVDVCRQPLPPTERMR